MVGHRRGWDRAWQLRRAGPPSDLERSFGLAKLEASYGDDDGSVHVSASAARCASGVRRDHANNVSNYTASTCTTIPLKADGVTFSSGWLKVLVVRGLRRVPVPRRRPRARRCRVPSSTPTHLHRDAEALVELRQPSTEVQRRLGSGGLDREVGGLVQQQIMQVVRLHLAQDRHVVVDECTQR